MREPTHIRNHCACGAPLVPSTTPNADDDEWVCGAGCEGLYFDWDLDDFILALGNDEGRAAWEWSRKR